MTEQNNVLMMICIYSSY